MEKDMEKINEHRRILYRDKRDGKMTTDHRRPINGKAWYSDEQFRDDYRIARENQ